MEALKIKWQMLKPKQRTGVMVIGAFLVLIILIMATSSKPVVPNNNLQEESSKIGIFETQSEATSVQSLDAKLKANAKNDQVNQERLKALSQQVMQVKDLVQTTGDGEESFKSLYEMNSKLNKLENENAAILAELKELRAKKGSGTPIQGNTVVNEVPQIVTENAIREVAAKRNRKISLDSPINDSVTKETIPNDPMAYLQGLNKPKPLEQENTMFINNSSDDVQGVNRTRDVTSSRIQIVDVEDSEVTPLEESNSDYRGLEILAGSQIPAIVVTGVDAPTGKAAEKGAIMSTLRITGPAITPNGNRVDLTGCFVTNDVRGDSATERAYFRPQRLTCQYDYGNVDIMIQGYVTGGDGSQGLRGKVKSKQGKALLYGTMSGGVSGIGNAFGGGNNTGSSFINGGSPFALPDADTVQKSATANAISNSSEFLMEYYKNKLDELYEVIEIKSLVPVSIHVQKSFVMKLNGNTNG